MSATESSKAWRYGFALLAVLIALVIRLALDPMLGETEALLAFVLAIMAAASFQGRRSGLAATALSVPVAWFFFVPPRYSFSIPHPNNAAGLLFLAAAGVGISLLAKGLRFSAPTPASGEWAPNRRGRLSKTFLRRAASMGGALIVLLVFTRLLEADLERERDRQYWVTHSYQVLDALASLSSAIEGAETGQRGFLLTGDPRYLQPFESAVALEAPVRRSLRQLVGGDRTQQKRLDALDRVAGAKLDELRTTIALYREGKSDAALALTRTGNGRRMMDEFRALLGEVGNDERQLLARRSDAAERQGMRMRWVLGLGSGTLLFVLLIAGAVIERDVQRRERARQLEKLSEQRLRLALDSANAGTWEWDLETNEHVWSDELWKLYGLEPRSSNPSYETWKQVVHPDDLDATERMLREAASAGTEVNVEFRVLGRNGSDRWLLTRALPLRNAEGGAARFVGIALDITARKRSEEALRAREENLRRFAEFAPVAIAMFDRQMRYMAASQRFREDYRLGAQELEGRNHYEIFPEVPERWREIHQRCLAGAVERHLGEPFLRADGTEQWIRWEIQPWQQADGSIGGIVLFSEDITGQKRSEQALQESEARLRLAQQVARVGTFEWNIQSGMNTWTPELEAIYGLEPGGFAGTQQNWEQMVHPEDRAETLRRVQQATETGRFDAEWRIVRPDGRVRWVAGRAWVFKDDGGKPLRLIGVNIDISDAREAGEALRRSQADLREAHLVAQLGSWFWDAGTDAVTCSEELYGICGLDPERPFPNLKEQTRIYTADSWQRLSAAVEAALQTGTGYELDLELVRPGGSVIWVTARGEAVRDAAGGIVGLHGTLQDVTRRKRAEEEILARSAIIHAISRVFSETLSCETEEALGRACIAIAEALTGSKSGFIGETNSEGRLDILAMTGSGRPESSHGETNAPLSLPTRGILGRVILDGKGLYANDPLSHPDYAGFPEGHPRLTAFLGVPLAHGGKTIGIIAVADREGGYRPRDLEALESLAPAIAQVFTRKRAEDALRSASEQRRLALEAAELGAWDYRFEPGTVLWDEACSRMFGVPVGSVSYEDAIARIHYEDRPVIEEALKLAIAGVNGGVYHQEFRVVWPDQSVHWIASHGRVHFHEEGGRRRPVNFTGVNVDITQRKQTELEIRLLNAQLEQRVRQRTAQLETANKELEAFSYSVSHDLRAPLRGIDGWSLALAEDYAGQLDERAQQYLDRVRSESQRMGMLIDDLLELSRVSRIEMQLVPVDLSAIANHIAGRLVETETGRQIEFVIEPELTAPGDARLLEVALTNLLGNAAKFTSPRQRARIEFGRCDSDGGSAFYVRDNGVGFDMAYAGTLFGAFQRLHKISEFPGTGIGLATVQRVIHRHGGQVWAQAEVDRGATFYFTIGSPK